MWQEQWYISLGEKKAGLQTYFFSFVKQVLKTPVQRKFDTCIVLMFWAIATLWTFQWSISINLKQIFTKNYLKNRIARMI